MLEFYPLVLHLANILYILGILFSDNLKLRIVLLAAGVLEFFYGLLSLSDGPIWEIVIWAALWSIINAYYTLKIARERVGIQLSDDEKRVKEYAFPFMTNPQFKKIIRIAKWKDYDANEFIIFENSSINRIIMVFEGLAKVESGDKEITLLKPGNFAGEMSYLTDSKTNANVISTIPMKIVYWDRADLNKILKNETELKMSFHSAFISDMIQKLNNNK